jgi:hypothetical protein
MMSRLAQMNKGGAEPGGAQPGPAAAPMATPQKKDGKLEQARVQVHIGMNMLESALGAFGAESKEGQVLLRALQAIGKSFGDSNTTDLQPAQLKQLFQAMPQMGGGSPMQAQIAKMQASNGPAHMPPPPAPMPAPQ